MSTDTTTGRFASSWKENLLGLLAIAVVGLALFLPHLLGWGTFIGDVDRLDTWLALRKYSVDSIRESGRVTDWDERMFDGYCTSGLHWMTPALDPFAYLQALLPEEDLYHVCGHLTCLFMILAGWAFFACARSFGLDAFPAVAGSCLHMMGTFALNRLAQVDWAFAILIAIPLVVTVLKRLRPGNRGRSFLALAALFVFLIVFTFLQEVAYAFLLIGLCALYQSCREKSWAPILVFSAAFGVALIIGLPRVITVAEEFSLMFRTHSKNSTNVLEVLRWFDDGIFGRTMEEAWYRGNFLNMHEGFQFYASTFATLFLLIGALRYGTWPRALTRAVFFGVLTLVLLNMIEGKRGWAIIGSYGVIVFTTERLRGLSALVMAALAAVMACLAGQAVHHAAALYFGMVALGLVWKRAEQPDRAFSDLDAAFLYGVISLCVAVVVLDKAQHLMYHLFFRYDFTHARITIAALVPMWLLVSRELQALLSRPEFAAKGSAVLNWRRLAGAAAMAGLALLGIHWFKENRLSFFGSDRQFALPSAMNIFPPEALQVLMCLAVLCLFALPICARRGSPGLRASLALALGLVLVGHCFANAYYQLFGPHTWSHPIAFQGHNYHVAPRQAFHTPSRQQLAQLHRRLETEQYRTEIVADPSDFVAYPGPHMAEFWRMRLVCGYGTFPERLARLPWADQAHQVRALTLSDAGKINWPLLAYLNTKYVVLLDHDFYANVKSHHAERDDEYVAGCDLNRITVLTNPLNVVPRAFFAESIVPAESASSSPPQRSSQPVVPKLQATITSPMVVRLEWQAGADPKLSMVIEKKDAEHAEFTTMATVGAADRLFFLRNLLPGHYEFRAFTTDGKDKSPASAAVVLDLGRATLPKPQRLQVVRTSPHKAKLTWEQEPGVTYTLERADARSRIFVPVQKGIESPTTLDVGDLAEGFRLLARSSGRVGERMAPHSKAIWLPATDISEDVREFRKQVPADPRERSIVEGIGQGRKFVTSGTIKTQYHGDRVHVDLDHCDQDRFLVLNEMYHPRWRATCDGKETPIYAANTCMRGLIVPAGTTQVDLEFVPFSRTGKGYGMSLFGLGVCFVVAAGIGYSSRSRGRIAVPVRS